MFHRLFLDLWKVNLYFWRKLTLFYQFCKFSKTRHIIRFKLFKINTNLCLRTLSSATAYIKTNEDEKHSNIESKTVGSCDFHKTSGH